MYLPASLVVTLLDVLVEVSVSVTVAPATTAFDWSVTAPTTVPLLVDCAHTGTAPSERSRKQNITTTEKEITDRRPTGIGKTS